MDDRDIGNLGNNFDTSQFLISGGQDGTWFQIVHCSDQIVPFTDYPSVKDGKPLHWDHPEYWKHKISRNRPALQLTVAGNAVSAEHKLKDMGYDAHAIQPTVIIVVVPEPKSQKGTTN